MGFVDLKSIFKDSDDDQDNLLIAMSDEVEEAEKEEESTEEVAPKKKRGRPKKVVIQEEEHSSVATEETPLPIKTEDEPTPPVSVEQSKLEKIKKLTSKEYRKNFVARSIKEANTLIDFPIIRHPMSRTIPTEGGNIDIPERDILYRSDTFEYLSDVSGNYNLITHKELIDSILGSIQNKYGNYSPNVKCIINDNGSSMWYAFMFESNTELSKEIGLSKEMLSAAFVVGNSYDRTRACQCQFCAYKPDADLTLSVSDRMFRFSMSHRNILKVDFFTNLLSHFMNQFGNLCNLWEHWEVTDCSQNRANLIFDLATLLDARYGIQMSLIDRLRDHLDSKKGESVSCSFRPTRWNLFKYVTNQISHEWIPQYTSNIDLKRFLVADSFSQLISNDKYFSMSEDDLKSFVVKEHNKKKTKIKEKEKMRQLIESDTISDE